MAASPNVQANPVAFRNLGKGSLAGVIFGCTNTPFNKCLSKQLLGLAYQHIDCVKNIRPGLPLFLVNYSDRKLHGIFEAANHGQMYIDPYGWTSYGQEKTPYPAQAQNRIRMQCLPLLEDQFKRIIGLNYYTNYHFWFELDHAQTSMLISLASTQIASHSSIPKYFPMRSTYQPVASLSDVRENEQLPHGGLEVNPPQQIEKDLVLEKLKELAFKDEFPILGSKGYLAETATEEAKDRELPGSTVDAQHERAENFTVYFGISCFPRPGSLSMDLMLIRELNELKDFKRQQTEKMVYLENKLDVTKSLSPITSAQSYASVAKLKGQLYVLAGGDGRALGLTPYSSDENTWTLQPSLNVKKGSLAGAIVGDKIFALGGRISLAAVEYNGAIYATCGFDGIEYLKCSFQTIRRQVISDVMGLTVPSPTYVITRAQSDNAQPR